MDRKSTRESFQPFILDERTRLHVVESIISQTSRPFNVPLVAGNILLAAEQVYPYLSNYDTIVAEGNSARLSSYVFWGLANAVRARHDKPGTQFRFVDVYNKKRDEPRGYYSSGSVPADRALIVTEVVSSGSSMRRAYKRVADSRGHGGIDALTVGAEGDWTSDGLGLPEGSTFFWHPHSEAVDLHLWGSAARAGLHPEYVVHDVKLMVGEIDACLHKATR